MESATFGEILPDRECCRRAA